MEKNANKLLAALVVILIFAQLLRFCKSESKQPDKTIPEISKDFKKQTPKIAERKVDTVYITEWETENNKDRVEKVQTLNPVNTSLAEAYKATKDSLDRFKLYLSAIEIKDFTDTFEDENLELFIHGQVQGDINWIKPSYVIKERKISESRKDVAFRLLLGSEFENNTSLNDLRFGVNAGFQNRKGNILRVGYSNQNSQHYITAGYDISILTIKK